MGHLELLYKPAALVPEESKGRLVVVSNRVPTTSAAPAAGASEGLPGIPKGSPGAATSAVVPVEVAAQP